MAQLFSPAANVVSRIVIATIILGALAAMGLAYAIVRSPYVSGVGVAPKQPVPFSHEHHAGQLGIDCRYCHTSVETSAVAGLPPTEICMTCHSQVWTQAKMLEPVRESWRTGIPMRWARVHDLPDFVYFNHSIHVRKGIGCSSCHGRVDRMPLVWKTETLFMSWCLECHRAPERFVRPRDKVFDMAWAPPADQLAQGRKLVTEYHIRSGELTDCYRCHR
ncbi:MAG: chaperone protein HtpG [Proteobacteria bacterium]|nr:chaperone protein HtpG [Pseudomonadota bacterium]